MKQKDLVELVLADLLRSSSGEPFPVPTPEKINVVGGKESVRREIIAGISQKYDGSEVGEGLAGGYNVFLVPFIRKYDPSFC